MIGLLEVYSASSYRLLQADENTKSLLLRQLIFIFLSWSVIFLARSVKLHYLLHPKIAGYGLALSIFFLVLVRIGIFGVTVNGAQRWISLGLLKSPARAEDRDRTVSRRSKPSSRTALMGEQPNPWDRLQPQDATSRHRGGKPTRRVTRFVATSMLLTETIS